MIAVAALGLFLTSFCGMTGGNAFARMASEPVLNPATYHSPDGRYRIDVNPSDRYGRGEASYRLTEEGEVLWTATLPFTLYEAAVTDDGFAAGYAYSFGLYGMSGEGYRAGVGDFRVVVIDRTGTLVLHEIIKREPSRYLHALPGPVGKGLIVDGPNERLVVRVADPDESDRREWWWNYTLSTGEIREKSVHEVSLRRDTIGEDTEALLPELSDVPKGELEHLGTFSFADEVGHPSPVFGVVDFDLDDRDRIGFLRGDATFVLVEGNGRLVTEIPLDLPSTGGLRRARVVWLSGDDWVVVHSNYGVGERAVAWRVNVANGGITALQGFDSPAMERIAGSRDGGFLVLARLQAQYSSTNELARFDRDGRARWRITDNDSRNPGALFSPSDIAVTADGSVALLSNVGRDVKFFDPEGTYLRTIDLEEVWGRRPNYPVGISVGPAGEIFVHDFNGTPPVVRMNAEGEVLGEFIPAFPDGRSFDPRSGIKVGPSGTVVAGEADALIRLSADGVPEHVLGPVPGEIRMGRVEAIDVDNNGWLYALEARSRLVQVYDDNGNWIETHSPDLPESPTSLSLAAMPDGTVNLGGSGRFALPSGGLLEVGFRSAHLRDPEMTVKRIIERRPDGNWLIGWGNGAVAPDGSFVLATRDDRTNTGEWQINLYRANGDPVRTNTISIGNSHSNFWYNGRNFVTQAESHLWLFDLEGRMVRKFPLPGDEFNSGNWEAFTTRGGSELWLVSRSKQVHRFAFPGCSETVDSD